MQGKALRDWREDAFLTQAEVAKALGVSRATVNMWENDRYTPQEYNRRNLVALKTFVEQLPRYAQSLGVTPLLAWQHVMQERFPIHTMSAWLKVGGDGAPPPLSALTERRKHAKELRETSQRLCALADWLEHGLVHAKYMPDGFGHSGFGTD